MLIDPAISTALSVSLAALFAASATHKARSFSGFAGVVRNYRIAPEPMTSFVSIAAIAAEASISMGLLIPASRVIAAVCGAVIFLIYGAAIAANLARGRTDIDCGCSFGGSGERLTPALIIRNLILAGLALAAAAPAGARGLGWFDYMSILLFALASAALYVAFESLRANAARFRAAGHI